TDAPDPGTGPMKRRDFIRLAGATGALAAAGGAARSAIAAGSAAASPGGQPARLAGAARLAGVPRLPGTARLPLWRPPVVSSDGLVLTAKLRTAAVAPGVVAPVWTPWPEGPIGPTIEARRGDRARIR